MWFVWFAVHKPVVMLVWNSLKYSLLSKQMSLEVDFLQINENLKAALDPCSLINSLAIYFDGVSCCKCLILRILNTYSFKTYQGQDARWPFPWDGNNFSRSHSV